MPIFHSIVGDGGCERWHCDAVDAACVQFKGRGGRTRMDGFAGHRPAALLRCNRNTARVEACSEALSRITGEQVAAVIPVGLDGIGSGLHVGHDPRPGFRRDALRCVTGCYLVRPGNP